MAVRQTKCECGALPECCHAPTCTVPHVCMCRVAEGFGHGKLCPWPLYTREAEEVKLWKQAWNLLEVESRYTVEDLLANAG